ncbi:MAG: calcium-binding protein, partial [Thermoleophilaceae bacterium]
GCVFGRGKIVASGVVALGAVLFGAVPARAGTASVVSLTEGRSPVAAVHYDARPGERNDVSATLTVRGGVGVATLTDRAGATPGAGCRRLGTGSKRVTCRFGSSGEAGSSGDSVAATPFYFNLGDGDDRAVVSSSPGDRGALFEGGTGNDMLTGAGGADTFYEGGTSATGSDAIDGRGGTDSVGYEGRRAAVRVTLGGGRDDGQRGERDTVTNVENARGGARGDALVGNARGNVLEGLGGADRISGGAGNDVLEATQNDDEISGTRTAKTADRLSGGAGDDRLIGSAGPNLIDGGRGSDRVVALGGNDRIAGRDRSTDDIGCGSGRDRASMDSFDFVRRGCERLSRKGRPRPGLLPSTASSRASGFRLSIGCPADMGQTCAVTVRLSAGRTLRGSGRARIRPGHVASVTVRLTDAGRRRLRTLAGRALTARFSLRARLHGGATRSVKGLLRLPLGPS